MNKSLINLIKENCDAYEFLVEPRGKVRMTQRDKWWQRNLNSPNAGFRNRAVFIAEYFKYKDVLNSLKLQIRYLQEDYCYLEVFIPLPPTILKSKKKTAERLKKEVHQQRPDADNILKGFLDALCTEDSHVYEMYIIKKWTDGPGRIIAYRWRNNL